MNKESQLFQERSDRFANTLTSEFKKYHGIYYTDAKLSADIISFLSIPRDASIIDPSCGTGSFIHSLLQRSYTDVYGCDFDDETVRICRVLTSCNHIFCIDSIGQDSSIVLQDLQHSRFDYVIGNPPYAPITKDITLNASSAFKATVSTSGNNLYVASLYRAFELAKDDGYISVIIPKSILHVKNYSRIRKLILENKSILSIIELGIHFKEVRGEQIVLTLKNSFDENNIIQFYSYSNGRFKSLASVRQSFYTDEIIVFTNNEEASIYSKLITDYKTLNDANVCKISRGRSKVNAIRGKQIRKYGFKDTELPTIGTQLFVQNIYTAEAGITATFAGELAAGETITIVKAVSREMSKYLLGILHSHLCNYFLVRFAYNNSRLTMHADSKYLKTIPFVYDESMRDEVLSIVERLEKADYLSTQWFAANEDLNHCVYSIYGLLDREVSYIETEMRTISSSKWYQDGNARTLYY